MSVRDVVRGATWGAAGVCALAWLGAPLPGGAPAGEQNVASASRAPLSAPQPLPHAPSWWVRMTSRLRWCESRGQRTVVSKGGRYRGAYQFDLTTWASVGGVGDPAAASWREQHYRAWRLSRVRGFAPWPVCGAYLR